ncbi:MAG: alpha/beta hydrolase [Actinomycetota bacterium]|nr:alpha/beta hydrolase [Actinomycetota bacterium]
MPELWPPWSAPKWIVAGAVGAGGAGIGLALEAAAALRRRSAPAGDAPVLPSTVGHRLLPMDDGGVLHLLEQGSGPALVLLHGFTLTSRVWAIQFSQLSGTHRVVAPDLRGHGRSRAGSGGIGLDRMADDVSVLLEALDLRDAVLVGHSMGGMVALSVAGKDVEQRRGRVGSLLLLGTSAGPLVKRMGWALPVLRALRGAHAPVGAAEVGGRPGGVAGRSGSRRRDDRRFPLSVPFTDAAWAVARIGFGRDPAPELVRMTWSMTAATSPRTVVDQMADLVAFDRARVVQSISLPTTVLVGSHDRVLPPWHSEKLARLMPAAELVTVPGRGHMLMLEDPASISSALEALAARAHRLSAPTGPEPSGG